MTDTPVAPASGAETPTPEKVGRSKVVLHIGTHKTATTTIQDTFWENSDLLAKHGVIYPRLGRVTGHHGLAYDWANLPPIYKLEDGSEAALRALNDTYAHQPVTLFLSSEEFSRGDPKGATDFAALRACLGDFDEIEVICALRPQWEFIQSIYLEVSKHRSPPRPPALLEAALKTHMLEGLWVDYNLLLDRLEDVFAPEEIRLFDFATQRKAPGGVLGAILAHLGVDLTAEDLTPVNGGASNVSPRPITAWAANVLAEPTVAPKWLLTLIEEAMDLEFEASTRSCLFTREEFQAVAAHFAPANQRLRDRRASVQPGFDLTAADITPLNLFRNMIPQSLWVRIGRRQTAMMIRSLD
ncbi:hypothetical protein [Jannaschia sp. M317]|uniref:hypothetical protein n=1 Tax=Jannaschia sp. M317 TaxID=2867011 RepID=UPI0021A5A807|nr:hypothetical protein [Jannaschia sp. M317]UWQ19639.1 hypothetical protein K3551_18250 [Jannaschia sp. M317]